MGDRRSGRLKSITYECAFHPSVCSPTNGCGCWQLAFPIEEEYPAVVAVGSYCK